MSSDASVSDWIAALKTSEESAAQHLYGRYVQRLVHLARKKLGAAPRRMADEEDVAQLVLNSFFRGVRMGRFPRLDDRRDLWQVLVMLTERKVIDQKRRQWTMKRRCEVGESALAAGNPSDALTPGMGHAVGHEPTPAFAAEVAEELELRLRQLDDQELRSIAIWKLEGRTNQEIARQLKCVTRTVERRLEMIRALWESSDRSAAPDPDES
jgi:RNA polymerase sigma factor (sigma-70 family)